MNLCEELEFSNLPIGFPKLRFQLLNLNLIFLSFLHLLFESIILTFEVDEQHSEVLPAVVSVGVLSFVSREALITGDLSLWAVTLVLF